MAFDLLAILGRREPPSEEEMAGFHSDILIGQAIILSHMNTDQEARLLAIGTLLAQQGMSEEEVAYLNRNYDALAVVAKNVAYLLAGTVISQEWR